jgi:hypothetical protein
MHDTRIGRLLTACLHQAIVDVLPERLDFYEEWLGSETLRDRAMGPAPMSAVLGFLRTESAYGPIMTRAGELAATWTLDAMPPFQRRAIALLPRTWRARGALRVASGIVRAVCSTTRTSATVSRGAARFDVTESLFCTVRERQTLPLCGFYQAVVSETLAGFGLRAAAQIASCHAIEGGACVIALDHLSGTTAEVDRPIAA